MAGRTTTGGWGWKHQQLRAAYQRRMDQGEHFNCWRCGRPIPPGMPWDLGHDDRTKTIYRGPEHRYQRHCPAGGNRKNGLLKAIRNRKARMARTNRWNL